MKTYIKTGHEEEYSNGNRTLGILVNTDQNNNRIDSLAYIYRDEMYIFFDTMIDMMDYLLYGDRKVKRAYISELDFDVLFDVEYLDTQFTEKLTWVVNE